jgi:hypothetical protein
MEVPWSEIDVALLDRLAVHRLEDGSEERRLRTSTSWLAYVACR